MNLRRWGLFNLVGLGGFAIQLTVIMLLSRAADWPPAAATAAGVELAFLHNFLGHSRWTWSDYPLRSGRDWLNRWWRYQLAKTASLGANVALTCGFVSYIAVPVELANAMAVVACALPNFLVADRLVFSQTAAATSRRECPGHVS